MVKYHALIIVLSLSIYYYSTQYFIAGFKMGPWGQKYFLISNFYFVLKKFTPNILKNKIKVSFKEIVLAPWPHFKNIDLTLFLFI